MSYRICKSFDFDAAHRLPAMGPEHKCSRLHGHTYKCDVILEGNLDGRFIVADYGDIAKAWEQIADQLDHRDLNAVYPNPTTEAMAWWILKQFRTRFPELPVIGIRLHESSTTWAECFKLGEQP